MSYKQIHETFWTDPDVKKYKPTQRYLFSYLITSPHAHYSGLYYLPLVYIENETGLSKKDVIDGLKFLTEKGHILYDRDREVIFVKSEMLYQSDNKRDGKVLLNEKQIAGLKKHFDMLHKTTLISIFLKSYPYLEIGYIVDTRIDTGMDTVSVPVPVLEDVLVTVKEGDVRGGTIPPKIDDVILYCIERAKGIDPQKFFDHYSARGWMIGKNKMKDWKAAVRTWENNGHNEHQPQQGKPKEKWELAAEGLI